MWASVVFSRDDRAMYVSLEMSKTTKVGAADDLEVSTGNIKPLETTIQKWYSRGPREGGTEGCENRWKVIETLRKTFEKP